MHFTSPVDCKFAEENAGILCEENPLASFDDVKLFNKHQVDNIISNLCQDCFNGMPEGTFFNCFAAEEYTFSLICMSNFLSLARFINSSTANYIKHFSFDKLSSHAIPIFYIKHKNDQAGLVTRFWQSAEAYLVKEGVLPDLSRHIVDLLKTQKWEVETDHLLVAYFQEASKKILSKDVVDVLTGDLIIKKGSVITSKDLVMLRFIKQAYVNHYKYNNMDTVIRSICISCVLSLIIVSIIRMFSGHQPFKKQLLCVTIFIISLLFSKGIEALVVFTKCKGVFGLVVPIVVPFGALLFYHFFNKQTALVMTGCLSFLCGYTFDSWDGVVLIGVNFFVTLGIMLIIEKISFFLIVPCLAVGIWLLSTFSIYLFGFYDYAHLGNALLTDCLVGVLSSLLTVACLIASMSMLEGVFRSLTGHALLSLMDRDHQLLSRLMHEAPGTYQHSLLVAQLAEEAAFSIGSDSILCRVASYYHDIGKLIGPSLFLENHIASYHDVHDLLTPLQSVKIIFAHVSEGVKIARQYKLPQAVIDVIEQHHGTSVVRFFYNKYMKEQGTEKDAEQFFRYPGIKPKSAESTIIMISDAVAGAFRSLRVVNQENIIQLIDDIILERFQDGQFSESTLSFDELNLIKISLMKTLLAMHHAHGKYAVVVLEKQHHFTQKSISIRA
ncbi:HDIG domain-containing metalloprotein [Candidatus Clavichlamydia salmonicola]|uniref:HDIG domain-containing metalloprotein n=1 Tax=Candidatus Clavichlamydia salmonicola TaxID=469812 RepID=UPI001891E245|nr:HDIG domain-containing metalloprotein [Candidatus Clavichlamydia salmonicola]